MELSQKKDIKQVQENVQNLARNKQNIIHELQDSLNGLNMTRIQVTENRHTINDIVQLLHVTDKKKLSNEIL